MRFHRLDLNHLVTLETLLVECSLTRAAQRLNVTQPAISNALTKLREHFGDELLVRRGRDMERTPFAEKIFGPLQTTLQQIRGIALAKPGFDPATAERQFRIVCSDYVATIFLADLIQQIAAIAPNVSILHVPIGTEGINAFAQGDADALIFPDGNQTLQQHPKRVMFTEHWVCIARSDNQRIADTPTPEQFYSAQHVVPSFKQYWADRETASAFERSPITLPFSAIPWLVVRSDYIAVLPERLAVMYEAVLPLRRIGMPYPIPHVAFIVQWHASSTDDPFKLWMLEQLQAAARKLDVTQAPTES